METMILPDLLSPGLKVIFCGTAAGTASANIGVYFAGRNNRFWDVLHSIGLTPRRLSPDEFRELLYYGIGLTDLIKDQSGMDNQLKSLNFGRDIFIEKVHRYSPKALCFNGKRSAQVYYDLAKTAQISYGRQPAAISNTTIFVLPSTSAAASRWWKEKYWMEVAKYLETNQ